MQFFVDVDLISAPRMPPPPCHRCRAPFENLILPVYCHLYQCHGPTCHSMYGSPTRPRFAQGYGDAYGQTEMDALRGPTRQHGTVKVVDPTGILPSELLVRVSDKGLDKTEEKLSS